MNARQKAKTYKRLYENMSQEAWRLRHLLRNEALRDQVHRGYGEVDTIKIVKYWDDRLPEEYIKNEIARGLAEFCLENNLIKFEKTEKAEPYLEYTRVTGTMLVGRRWGDSE